MITRSSFSIRGARPPPEEKIMMDCDKKNDILMFNFRKPGHGLFHSLIFKRDLRKGVVRDGFSGMPCSVLATIHHLKYIPIKPLARGLGE